jgi:hypothetical protein
MQPVQSIRPADDIQDQYECHLFIETSPGYVFTRLGEAPVDDADVEWFGILHGTLVAPPHPGAPDLPLPGALRWHYLQCVINRFGHSAYKLLQRITCPLETLDNSGPWHNLPGNLPWPNAGVDLARVRIAHASDRGAALHSVEEWRTNAPLVAPREMPQEG